MSAALDFRALDADATLTLVPESGEEVYLPSLYLVEEPIPETVRDPKLGLVALEHRLASIAITVLGSAHILPSTRESIVDHLNADLDMLVSIQASIAEDRRPTEPAPSWAGEVFWEGPDDADWEVAQ